MLRYIRCDYICTIVHILRSLFCVFNREVYYKIASVIIATQRSSYIYKFVTYWMCSIQCLFSPQFFPCNAYILTITFTRVSSLFSRLAPNWFKCIFCCAAALLLCLLAYLFFSFFFLIFRYSVFKLRTTNTALRMEEAKYDTHNISYVAHIYLILAMARTF